MEQLVQKLQLKNLIDKSGNIILSDENGIIMCVDQQTFQGFFGNTDFSYTQLCAVDGTKGYKPFFDIWAHLGIL